MPEIIGKDESKAHRYTCSKCGTIFQYYEYEVRKAAYKDISGCTDVYWEINCPGCGQLKQICK